MQQKRIIKKKNRIKFERLMAHLGYAVCVLSIWTFSVFVSAVVFKIFWS